MLIEDYTMKCFCEDIPKEIAWAMVKATLEDRSPVDEPVWVYLSDTETILHKLRDTEAAFAFTYTDNLYNLRIKFDKAWQQAKEG
jgi:hypothetical protein